VLPRTRTAERAGVGVSIIYSIGRERVGVNLVEQVLIYEVGWRGR
jgi:hypothetical protein